MQVLITEAPVNVNWFEFGLTTSVLDSENTDAALAVFPNPSNNHIQIKAEIEDRQQLMIKIVDYTGVVRIQHDLGSISRLDRQIAVDDLVAGVYLLVLELANGVVMTERFVKL